MSRPGTDRLKFNPPLGTLPVLQYLMPDQLQIDPQYQRTLDAEASQTLVRGIAQHWNWDLCQPLVVARRADGRLYVIDGQHRLAAAKLRGDIAQLPAQVVHYASVEDEAASFVLLNQQRKPLTRLDLFKAAVASADTTAAAIVEAMTAAGLRIAPHSNYTAWKPGMVSNIGGIEACWRARGAVVTRLALKALAEAFDGQVLRYAGTLFPGIAAVVDLEVRDTRGVVIREIDAESWDLLIMMLRGASQDEWRREIMRARATEPNLKFAPASAKVFLRAWKETLGEAYGNSDGQGDDDSVASEAAADSGDDDEEETGDEDAAPMVPGSAGPASIAPPPRPVAAAAKPKTAPTIDLKRLGQAARGETKPGELWGRPAAPRKDAKGTIFKPDEAGKAWCDQCDRRRTRGEVLACRDSHCPFERPA
jgi:hypothetical protein